MRFTIKQLLLCCTKLTACTVTDHHGRKHHQWPHVTATITRWCSLTVTYHATPSPHRYCCCSTTAQDEAGHSWSAWVGAEGAAKGCIVVYGTADISGQPSLMVSTTLKFPVELSYMCMFLRWANASPRQPNLNFEKWCFSFTPRMKNSFEINI